MMQTLLGAIAAFSFILGGIAGGIYQTASAQTSSCYRSAETTSSLLRDVVDDTSSSDHLTFDGHGVALKHVRALSGASARNVASVLTALATDIGARGLTAHDNGRFWIATSAALGGQSEFRFDGTYPCPTELSTKPTVETPAPEKTPTPAPSVTDPLALANERIAGLLREIAVLRDRIAELEGIETPARAAVEAPPVDVPTLTSLSEEIADCRTYGLYEAHSADYCRNLLASVAPPTQRERCLLTGALDVASIASHGRFTGVWGGIGYEFDLAHGLTRGEHRGRARGERQHGGHHPRERDGRLHPVRRHPRVRRRGQRVQPRRQ